MATLQRYTDRRVLITGGGSGIGQACVLRVLEEGGRVAAADISESGLKDTVAKAGDAAAGLTTVAMDVGSEDSVKAGVQQAIQALGGLDTLVNVAGILRSAHFLDTSLADFEQVLRINLVGTFRCVAKSAAGMLTLEPGEDGERGAMVMTASVAAEDDIASGEEVDTRTEDGLQASDQCDALCV